MSELENLAVEVRGLAADGNRLQQLVAAMANFFDSESQRLASMRHLQHLDGMREAQQNLNGARLQANGAAQYLHSLQTGAEDFAKHLVGGQGASGSRFMSGIVSGLASVVGLKAGSEGSSALPSPAQTSMTLEEIRRSLGAINPDRGDPFDPNRIERQMNCGNVAANVHDMLNGGPAVVAPQGILGIEEMNERTGKTQVEMAPEDIVEVLRNAGAGSHVVVGVDRLSTDGHWFNAYFDGENVWTIDGQPTPPVICIFPPLDVMDIYRWDASL